MARKPQPGGDRNAWGAILNEYFDVAHNTDGTIKPAGVQTAVATEVETALSVQLPPAVAEEVAAQPTVVNAAAAAIDAEPRVAANTAGLARVDPGEAAPKAGAVVAQGIMGPVWQKGPVSADWFSDPNDAIAAAGVGGHVSFTEGVTYSIASPIQPLSGQTIEGGDRGSANIVASGGAAIASPTPTTAQIQNVIIRGLNLVGNDAAGIGLDARGMTRCRFDDLWIEGFTTHGVWWGGDQSTDIGGWSNLAYNLRVRAPLSGGAAMYFGGRVGTSGPATANNIVVIGGALYTRAHANSYGVHIEHGGGNRFYGIDMGYGVDSGAAIYLSHDIARQNLFTGIRTENVKRAVIITGGKYNVFEGCAFGLYSNTAFHGAEIGSGSLRNVFRDNWWASEGLAPRVWESGGPGSYETIIDDQAPDFGTLYGNVSTSPKGVMNIVTGTGSVAFGAKIGSEARERLLITGSGDLKWRDPATGSAVATLSVDPTTKVMSLTDGVLPRLASTSRPPASATYVGVLVRVAGGSGTADKLSTCLKKADGTYAWVDVVSAP